MNIRQIKEFPTSLDREYVESRLRQLSLKGFHESVLRSYQTLEKVKELLRINTPPEVVLEIIEEIYS
jgi:hypothetical protein